MISTIHELSKADLEQVYGGFKVVSMPDSSVVFSQPGIVNRGDLPYQYKNLPYYLKQAI